MSITTLNLGKIRLNWRGPWVTATVYTLNDAVSFGGSSYVCVFAHTSGTWSIDFTAVYWQLMAQGTTTNTTAGDITYYGSIGNTRLPIGTAGQVLTVGTSGFPQWGNPNAEGSVYYVSDDTGNDAYNGTSLNAAFKTLRKACDTITGPATVYVKAGTYNEKLPITVPANVTIIGDGMRNTTITALVGSATATYTSSGSSGTTLKVSSTSGIAVGMTVTGTGFSSAQKITVVVDSTTLTLSAAPDTTPSGTLTFRHLSTDASPVVNNLSTMFLLSDQTMLQGLLMTGMTGFASGSPANDITAATIGGVYLRLNPASTIANKSPYIKDCSAISAGGVGAIVDGSVHGSGNKSMVFWAYNIVQDGGVGLWVLNGGRVEAVSVFTYYCYIGYVTTSGGQIRSLSGNNSYGTYGAISSGFLSSETPVTGTVYGGMLTYNTNTLTGSFTQGETVTQATSGATGIVTSAQTGYLYYKSSSGTFNTTNVVTGGTSGATMTPSTVGGQANYILVLSSVSAVPQVGASIQFATGDTGAYIVSAVSTATVNSVTVYIVTLAQQKVTASTDGVIANIRYNFSLIRLTGHDFLFIGTGGVATTNYPGIPSQGPTQANQIVYTFPGRVYYVATDEKGNFNVGQYFSVNQATGAATLNANAFNLSGLTSLRLGSIGAQLGAQVDEFSTDGTLSANSNTKVPTQAAVRTYLGSAYQHIKPVIDLTYDLGDATHRWRSLYVGPGSITLGTVVLSDNGGSLTVTGTGPATFGNTTITGNLTVNGTTTTINSATMTVDDKNLELGSVATITGLTGTIVSSATTSIITGLSSTVGIIPGQALTKVSGTGVFGTSPLVTSVDSATQITITSNTANTTGSITFDVGGATDNTANGGGITLKGTTDKTLTWSTGTSAFTSSEDLNLVTGKQYEINGVGVLSASTLSLSGSTVLTKSILTLNGSSSGTVAFQAAAAAGSITYTLPSADAAVSGYALVSNASGTLSWAAAGATLADDIATTTLYPVLSTSATGSLSAAKTTATKLTFNASTGYLTAAGGIGFSSAISFSGSGYQIGKDGADFLAFSGGTAGTRFISSSSAAEWVRIDSSGNLLVGTTTAAVETGSIATAKNLEITRTIDSDGGALGQLSWVNNTNAGVASGTSFAKDVACIKGLMDGTGNNSGGYLTFETKADAGTRAERMRIASNGYVGIQNTVPAAPLHVGPLNGSGSLNGYTRFALEATDYAVATWKCPAANFSQILFTDTTTTSLGGINYFNSTNATPNAMAFLTAGTERMRIDSSGNVGIGSDSVTVLDAVSASRRLVVVGSDSTTSNIGSTASITISNSDTTTNNTAQINFAARTGANTSHFSSAIINCKFGARTNGQYPTGILTFATSTTLNAAPSVKMTLGSEGNLTVTGTITSNSDARLKTNVETITGALDKVLALRGVMFDRIETGTREMGQIAQEAEAIVPELVFTDENGIKSIAYANTVALLIEAIKEQQQQINELKGRI